MVSLHMEENVLTACFKLVRKTQLHCPVSTVQYPGIVINADDWEVVFVSALYGASPTAYAEKTQDINLVF